MQDAGLYTHQRTLDIRFVDDELALHRAGKIRGSAFAVTCKQYTDMVDVGAQVPHSKVGRRLYKLNPVDPCCRAS